MKIENAQWQLLFHPLRAVNFLRRNAEPQAPETVRHIPRKQLEAIMEGAAVAMRELTEFAKRAKSRLGDDRPIVQDDLLELLRMLRDAQKRIDAQIESDIGKSTDTSDTEWNKQFYNLYIAPVSQMADSPQAIVDFTLAASNNGAKDARLLYDLVVAEMDVAIARFNVTLSLITKERGARPK
ncbi:MAG TPA: hypothetical protein VFJ59_03445 [Pseudolabrys sp.]|nr:hypothetical protein [Pseudolabrys sp.]